ncbi:MAG: DNA primase [Lachnospiraceae bacterium]|nr:DNA primase [Lachnospiraceae bacterium]
MYYPEEIVDEVGRANDIVDIIGQYVKLKRQGSRYVGLCPFHNEKTPSFSVSADMQLYHCFGCGVGGNVFTFVMEYENYTFQEAIEYLAERAGIELPRNDGRQERAEDSRRKQMLEANKLAARYFYYQLKSKQGSRAWQYLKDRGLSDETIVGFGLGYSNISPDDLYRYLRQKGFHDEILAECGLVKVDEKGAHDRFWNRVMFPIMDVNNRVIGFGGRVMGDGLPKYLNSPETKLFDKSRNLYGLHAAKKARKDYFLLCEGYMDVIALHQAGFTNAVASLGTAFTPQHAILMKRYVKQVILTFDSDNAGVNAALRAIPILKRAGLSVKVLNMRPHKDPDEFIKAEGAEAYEERIRQAQNSFLFEIGVLRSQYDFRDPEQKTAFQTETAKRLLEFEEEMERSNYIEAVALAYDMNAAGLRRKVNQMGANLLPGETWNSQVDEAEQKRREEKKRRKDTSDKKAQRMLLAWLCAYPAVYGQVKTLVTPDDFTQPGYRRLAQLIYERLENSEEINPSELTNHFINDEQEYKMISEIFHTGLGESVTKEEKEKIFTDLVRKVKSDSLRLAGRDASDLMAFQEIVKTQELLRRLHISLDV